MNTDTDQIVRTELIEAIMHLNREAIRLPTHFVDKKAALHARIDELLTLLELCDG